MRASLSSKGSLGAEPVLSAAAAVVYCLFALQRSQFPPLQVLWLRSRAGKCGESIDIVFVFQTETDSRWMQSNQPSIAGTGSSELEKRVQQGVQKRKNRCHCLLTPARKPRTESGGCDLLKGQGPHRMDAGYFWMLPCEIKSSNEKYCPLSFIRQRQAASAYTTCWIF